MNVIQLHNVWEMFRIKFIEQGKIHWENFWALKDICVEVEQKETVGIIGENGSGKSTLLKLIAGMLKPDRGKVYVEGRVSGLLELGSGFEVEMTGQENVFNLSSLYGLNQDEIKNKFKQIADFAGLGRFIHAPLKCYSQGMFVRLAFSLAIHMEPNIFLIDDTLAVGDEEFQKKCLKKIFELKEKGMTMLFVSHDINMLRRLCNRVILLKQGRLIKDGPIEKVVPLYTHMVGTKEGVGILECKDLSVVFNNGRIFLNWQDNALTSSSGIYTTFCINTRWYSSGQAEWKLKRETDTKLTACGTFYQLGITQVWKIELRDNAEILLDIEVESEYPLEIEEARMTAMLINEYNQWFTMRERGLFPAITKENKQWSSILDGSSIRKCIAVQAQEIVDKNIPSIIFEESDITAGGAAQLFNAEGWVKSRVLQFKRNSVRNYSDSEDSRLVYFSGILRLDIKDIQGYLNTLDDQNVICSGPIKLRFDRGHIEIFYKDTPLTKSGHLTLFIRANGRWYASDMASWSVSKINHTQLVAQGRYASLPLTHEYEIAIQNERSFVVKTSIEVQGETQITEQYARLEGSERYEYYYSDYGEGKFPERFMGYEIDMLQRCITQGPVRLSSNNAALPSCEITFSQDVDNFIKIFNSDVSRRAREIRIEKVEPERNEKFLPGEYPCFEIAVALDESTQCAPKPSQKMIAHKKLRVSCEQGQGHIYWAQRELTKRWGIYTSLRSAGRWFGSYLHCRWSVEEENDSIVCVGKWIYLPIVQRWQLVLEDDKVITFKVRMEVEESIEVDRLQTNIMLSEQYSEWCAGKGRGIFPSFKGHVDDDWETVWSSCGTQVIDEWYVGALDISEEERRLPSIKFCPQQTEGTSSLNIINSDISHRGRVLQYLSQGRRLLEPGQYAYYEGKIKIDS